ncbi:hypothetical protein D3C81_757720 [compost metagenome]
MLLNGQNSINKGFYCCCAIQQLVVADSFRGGGHTFHHIAVSIAEAHIIFEEITVGEYMRNDQFILNQRIALQQKGVTRIGVNDELINFA